VALKRPPTNLPLRVVAFIGFPAPLPRNLRGVINGCGLTPLACGDIPSAFETLQRTLRVDAIVIDGRALACAASEHAHALLAFATAAPWDGLPLPVVVITRRGMRPDLGEGWARDGVHVLPSHSAHYMPLGRLLYTLCGLPGDCCIKLA
jgi:hypothetical protein